MVQTSTDTYHYKSAFLQSDKPKRLCLPIFNRATYARCKALIEAISQRPSLHLTVILSSALLWDEYGNAASYIEKGHRNIVFEKMEIEYPEKTHQGMVQATSLILSRLGPLLAGNRFDAVVVVADRFETLPAAMAAAYQNIPVIHLQGGEVTGNIDDRVRHAVTKLADYHFVCTKLAKDYLIEMGEESKRVMYVGCPSIDLVRNNRILRGPIEGLVKDPYILAIFHPETEHPDEAFTQTEIVLKAVLEYCVQYGHRCYWYYPNPDPGREEITRLLDRALSEVTSVFRKAVNQPPEKFLERLAKARLVIGNSSVGLRESAYIGVPSINVGERQGCRERSWNVLDATYDHANLLSALHHQHGVERYRQSMLFGDGRAASHITRYIEKLDLTLKPHLTYPTSFKYRQKHMGENRFDAHSTAKRALVPPGRQYKEDYALHP